jgi:hypothetical protein
LELINFIFRIGVVFAIFGFIWGFINIGYSILRGKNNNLVEAYIIKAIKYFFLVDVVFLFGYESFQLNINQLLTIALILLTYFISKLQNQQEKKQLFKIVGQNLPIPKKHFNFKAEVAIIIFSLSAFVGFMFFPEYSENQLSLWFHDSIIDIENTPIFGFIFKVIGFIFIVNLFSKLITSLNLIFNRKNNNDNSNDTDIKEDDNKFDEFEEIE